MPLVKTASELENLQKVSTMKISTKLNAQGRSNLRFLVVVRDDSLNSTNDSKIFA